MGEGEAIARMRRQVLSLTAGLCLSILLFTAWGTLAPIDVTVIPVEPDLWVAHAWPGAADSFLWFLVCMAGWPVGATAWALVVQQRRLWPMNRAEPAVRAHVALRVVPLTAAMGWVWLSMTLLGDGRYEVVPDRALVDLSGTPLQTAINATITLGGSWALAILSWPIAVTVLRQWNPGRPVAWLEPRASRNPGAEAASA